MKLDAGQIKFLPANDLVCARCGATPPFPHKGTCDYSLMRSGEAWVAGVDEPTDLSGFEESAA